MTRDEIIDKIKKLLRMKRGGTLAEVETALALARELAAKHGIDLESINPDEEQAPATPVGHEDAFRGSRVQFECKYAALVAETFFGVKIFTRRVPTNMWPYQTIALTFVGTDWDRQIAIYVYRFLVGAFRREWSKRRGRCRNRQAFMWGMYVGICTTLRDRQPKPVEGPGLIRIERAAARVNNYLAKHFPNLREHDASPDSNAKAAEYYGYLAGRQTEIRKGLGDRNAQGQQLLQ